MSPDEARKAFSHPDDLIFRDEKSWIPVEVTESAGFLAGLAGRGQGVEGEALLTARPLFYPLHDAWKMYEPVGLPGADVTSESSPSERIVSAYQAEADQVRRPGDVRQGRGAAEPDYKSARILESRPTSWAFSMRDMASTIGRKRSSRSCLTKEEYVPAL